MCVNVAGTWGLGMSDHSSTILIIVFVMLMSVLGGLEHMRAPEKSRDDIWREYARQLWLWLSSARRRSRLVRFGRVIDGRKRAEAENLAAPQDRDRGDQSPVGVILNSITSGRPRR